MSLNKNDLEILPLNPILYVCTYVCTYVRTAEKGRTNQRTSIYIEVVLELVGGSRDALRQGPSNACKTLQIACLEM